MRHWNFRRDLLRGTAILILGLIFSCGMLGCNSSSSSGDIAVSGLVVLAAADGAALEGLIFDFPEATIFGFPGESATLQIGENAATFTLTIIGRAVINGTLSNGGVVGSCQLTQNPAEVGAGEQQFVEDYTTCEATVASNGNIAFGGSGNGTVILRLGRAGETPVASATEDVTINLHGDGTVTINMNDTPI